MDLFEAFFLDMPKCIRLVPAIRENIKRYLTTNSKGQAIVRIPLLQDLDKGCSHSMYLKGYQLSLEREQKIVDLIIGLEIEPFLNTR